MDTVKCQSCGAYRKLETLINLLTNPMKITNTELKILKMRRAEEISEFEKLLKVMPSPKEKCKLYCLEMEWYLQWKAFVMNDQSEKIIIRNRLRISENPEIGKIENK